MRNMYIAFEEELHTRLKIAAALAHVSMGDLVRTAVEGHVTRLEEARTERSSADTATATKTGGDL